MTRQRAFVLLLAVLMIVVGLPVAASRDQVLRPTRVLHQQAAPAIPGIDGSDACGMLSDEVLLQATGADQVVSRVPDTNGFIAASCDYHLTSADDPANDLTVMLAVQPTGGRSFFDSGTEGQTLVAGIGDAAVPDGMGGWTAVKGDTLVLLNYLAFGAPRSPEVAARTLIWRIMRDLPTGDTAVAPVPSEAPVPIATSLVERLRVEPFGDDTVAAAIEILARSGIATYGSPSASAPIVPIEGDASPITLLEEQVRAMASEAWANAGLVGADLDALMPTGAQAEATDADTMSPESVPVSWMLAGYVAAVDTEGAQVARALMGEQDWYAPETLVFPQLVLTLFTSDIARDQRAQTAVGWTPDIARAANHRLAAAEIRTAQAVTCSTITNFIDSSLARVFDWLRISNRSGNVVVSLWNFVVGLAESAARAIVRELTQPVLDAIARVAAIAGMAAQVVSAIRPWTVTVTSDPTRLEKSIGILPGEPGRFTVRVNLNGFDEWPTLVTDCAKVAGRTLPDLRPQGARVDWRPLVQQPGGLVGVIRQQDRLDANGTAALDIVTLADDLDDPMDLVRGRVTVPVRVERPELRQLVDIGLDELFGRLGKARAVLEPWLRPEIAKMTNGLASLIQRGASGSVTVWYHVVPPALMVHAERGGMRVLELTSCSGPYGPWTGWVGAGGIARVPLARLPISFTFRGTQGLQATTTPVAAEIPWDLPGVTSNVRILVRLTATGRWLTVSSTGAADMDVRDTDALPEVLDEVWERPTRLRFERAPEGACGRGPTR